jgi:hypothetical protein
MYMLSAARPLVGRRGQRWINYCETPQAQEALGASLAKFQNFQTGIHIAVVSEANLLDEKF